MRAHHTSPLPFTIPCHSWRQMADGAVLPCHAISPFPLYKGNGEWQMACTGIATLTSTHPENEKSPPKKTPFLCGENRGSPPSAPAYAEERIPAGGAA